MTAQWLQTANIKCILSLSQCQVQAGRTAQNNYLVEWPMLADFTLRSHAIQSRHACSSRNYSTGIRITNLILHYYSLIITFSIEQLYLNFTMTGSQCLHLPQYKRISKIEISSVMIMASNEMHGQWPFLYLHNILPAKRLSQCSQLHSIQSRRTTCPHQTHHRGIKPVIITGSSPDLTCVLSSSTVTLLNGLEASQCLNK